MFSLPHTYSPKSYKRSVDLGGEYLEDLKLSAFQYPMWFEQMSSLELYTQSSRAWAEGSASAGPCMTNFLSASDFIII